ncbi:MAG: type I-C CRISPR-associated protein Cas8c/Csd1 [bacterium]
MLLKHLYDFAISRNLLSDPAFSAKAVRWIIDLDDDGNLLGQGPVDTATDGKRGNEFPCPQTTRAKYAGGVSEFLADGITAVFGLEGNWKTVAKKSNNSKWLADRNINNAAKKADFWRQMEACGKSCTVILACLKYIQKTTALPPFLRKDGTSWKITSASGAETTLGPENFTFRVNGELLLENKEMLNWWRSQHSTEVSATKTSASKGLCIITGQPDQPIAETHGVKIMSVPGGQAAGASLVSFDKDAFSSYGFSKSQNCPTSVDAATAYCTALNHLIQSEDTSLRLGNTVLCFWAVQTKSAGSLFAGLLNKPDPQTVSKFMKSPWAGFERELAKKDLFIAVTFKGCSGRVAVSNWIQKPLDQAIENVARWFDDLDIVVPAKNEPSATKKAAIKNTAFNPLSIYWLANTMPPLKRDKGSIKPDMDKLQTEVASQLYCAALEGTAPSIALIKPILNQLHSRLVGDKNYKIIYDQSRFALLKLILNRNRKESDMEIRTQIIANTNDPAYNCGRLLSLLSETQRKSRDYPKEFTGVAERYFGTASTSPTTVFPLLIRLYRHHLDKIRKSGGSDYQDKQIQDIIALFKPQAEGCPPVFPRHLDLQAQGRFALGFYQQQASDAVAREEAREHKSGKAKNDSSQQSEPLNLVSE